MLHEGFLGISDGMVPQLPQRLNELRCLSLFYPPLLSPQRLRFCYSIQFLTLSSISCLAFCQSFGVV